MKKPVKPPARSQSDYLHAAMSVNTRKSYLDDVAHYEQSGGALPARPRHIVDYLYRYSETLGRRLAGLSNWHKRFEFDDPTQTKEVRDMLAGIRRLNGTPLGASANTLRN